MTFKIILYLSGEHRNQFCCSKSQVSDLQTNFALIDSIIGRCPSCARNMRKLFCDMTCRPDQSKFLAPNSTVVAQNPKDKLNYTLVESLNFYIRDKFPQDLYDSCKDVTNPSSNSLAITLFCATWGDQCNAHR